MSIAAANVLKHHAEVIEQLQLELTKLAERVLALEAEKESPAVELDIDTLAPKRRGRPPKVVEQ